MKSHIRYNNQSSFSLLVSWSYPDAWQAGKMDVLQNQVRAVSNYVRRIVKLFMLAYFLYPLPTSYGHLYRKQNKTRTKGMTIYMQIIEQATNAFAGHA